MSLQVNITTSRHQKDSNEMRLKRSNSARIYLFEEDFSLSAQQNDFL